MIKLWRKRWTKILVLLFVILACLSAGPAFLILNPVLQTLLTPLSKVESYVGISVPKAATDLHHRYISWQGIDTLLRFSLPAKDMLAYVAQLQDGKDCLYANPEDNHNPLDAGWDKTNWFKPSLVKVYAGQECFLGEKVYYLLIDKTNPTYYTIYLAAGEA